MVGALAGKGRWYLKDSNSDPELRSIGVSMSIDCLDLVRSHGGQFSVVLLADRCLQPR